MIVIRTPQEKIDEYFISPAINQSLLKAADKGVKAFENAAIKIRESKNEFYYNEPSENLIIGSGVDCMITQGREVFDLQYYVATEEVEKPSDAIMSIVKAVFDSVIAEDIEVENELQSLSFHREKILLSVAAHNWNTRWSDEVKYNKIFTDGTPYWKLLVESRGKTILTLSEYTTIVNVADSIINSYAYKEAIINDAQTIVIFQLPIYFYKNRVHCKALLDMVVISVSAGTITAYDFKTMAGKVEDFVYSMRRFRYDIQAAWYVEALKSLVDIDLVIDSTCNQIPQELYNSLEYKLSSARIIIEPFNFIVASTTNKSKVVKFEVSKELSRIGWEGRSKSYYESYDTVNNRVYVQTLAPILGASSLLDLARFYLNGNEEDFVTSIDFLLDWDEIRESGSGTNQNENG